MPPAPDPYRTLGLPRGASLDEVKRAYRQLAKETPPRRGRPGGPAAVPGDPGGVRAARPRGWEPPPGRSRARPPRPSAADPDRADATHRAYGGRARRAKARPAPGRRRADGRTDSSGGRDRPGRGRSTSGATGAGDGPTSDPEPARAAGKATLGSTSYDGADADAVRAGLGRRELVRHDQRHLLDDQSQGIRRSPQARAGVPGPRPAAARASRSPADGAQATDRTRGLAPDGDRRCRGRVDDAAGRRGRGRGPPRAERPSRRRAGHTTSRGGTARSTTRTRSVTTAASRPTRQPGPSTARPSPPPPPPDLGAAAADLGRALTDERPPAALADRTGGRRLAADRARRRLARRGADGLQSIRRELRRRGRLPRADRRDRDPRACCCSCRGSRRSRPPAPSRSRSSQSRRRAILSASTARAADRRSAASRSGSSCSSPGSSGVGGHPALRPRSGIGRPEAVPYPEGMPPRHDPHDLSTAAQQYLLALRVMAGSADARSRDRRADRAPPRGDHPGRQRDVPPARRRRTRRPRRGPRTAPDPGRARRRGRHLPPPRPARVAADHGHRAGLGRVR